MLQWNGEQFVAKVKEQVANNLERAGIFARNTIRQDISIPSRTVSIQYKGGRVKRVLGPRGSSRSKPGEFPHKDTGMLRQSIGYDVDRDNLRLKIGTPLRYGLFLEVGTARMAPRPFLRRFVKENRETMRQLIVFGGRTDITVK